MLLTITTVSQEFTKNGDEYYKVIGVKDDGQTTTKLIFNNLQAKWGLLKENATLEFKLEKKGQFWDVADINPVQFPPGQKPINPPRQIDEPPNDIFPQEAATFKVDARTHDIHRQVSLKCAVDLACHGLIKLGELKEKSEMLLRYLDGE